MTLVELPPSPTAPGHAQASAALPAVAAPVRSRRVAATAEPEEHEERPQRGGIRRYAGDVVLSALALVAAFPIVWMYLTSFRPPDKVLSAPLFSTAFGIGNYSAAITQLPIWHLVANTAAMAVAVSIGQVFTGLLCAYAFTRFRFRGDRLLFVLVVATWLVPFQVTMLPNYVLISRLGLLNAIGGVIIPQLASAIAVLLLRQHLRAFPTELIDAARIDGQGSWATLWRVVVPNLAPSLAALGILLFVSAWNEYFWPLLVFHTPVSVLQIAIENFLSTESTNYGGLMATSGLACLPIFVVYVILQRRVVNAFVRSGLK